MGDKRRMTEEQIKQTAKITEFARNMVKQSNYPEDLQDHIIATCMVVVTEATKELEKENAELKDKLKNQKADYEIYYKSCYNAQKKAEKHLTKAKELLNEFMRISKASDEDFEHDYSELIGEAEQFLNSEVEK